jgi:hypothetical protein
MPAEGEERQQIDQDSVDAVDDDVDDVIAGDFVASDVVVESEAQVCDGPVEAALEGGAVELPDPYLRNADEAVLDDVEGIVEHERRSERVRIEEPHDAGDRERYQGRPLVCRASRDVGHERLIIRSAARRLRWAHRHRVPGLRQRAEAIRGTEKR